LFERILERLDRSVVAQAFERLHIGLRAIVREREARAHRAAVDRHRARAADPLIASALGCSKLQPVAQHGQQRVGKRPLRY
jgi:hypothetical protein